MIGSALPRLDWVTVRRNGRDVRLPYCHRSGTGPAVLLIHGLGGSKENFGGAFQTPALRDCELLAFDLPGTGLAEFDPDVTPDVTALADLAYLIWHDLMPQPAYLVGASMGGLIALLVLRRYGAAGVRGFVNIEGNLAPEDCMFSRRASSVTLAELSEHLFDQIRGELRRSRYPGDHMVAHNMALNTDKRAYHAYSLQTVRESDSGKLLEEFLALAVPKLFLYGEANRRLSYLPRLREGNVAVREVPKSAHFLFYDDPVTTFEAIARFFRHSAS